MRGQRWGMQRAGIKLIDSLKHYTRKSEANNAFNACLPSLRICSSAVCKSNDAVDGAVCPSRATGHLRAFPSSHTPRLACNKQNVVILAICSLPCRQQRVRRRIVGHPPSFPVSHQPSQVALVVASRLLSCIFYNISFRAASSALPQKNIFIKTERKPHFCSIAPEFWFAIMWIQSLFA
jgi:hypothetical protein